MPMRQIIGCLVALVVSAPVSLAYGQASRIDFAPSEGTPQYQPLNPFFYPDIKLQMVMYSDTGGTTIVDQYDCSILSNCLPGRNGAYGSYRVTLTGLAGTNVEMLGSTCDGVSPGGMTCFDGPLVVALRVKTGRNRIQIVGSASPGARPTIITGGVDLFFYLGADPNVYWQTGNGGANRFPQGTWNPVAMPTPTGNCHPEPVDPNFTVTVTDSLDAPIVFWPWRGTVCDYYVQTTTGGGTVTNASGTFTCVMPRGVTTRCDFSVPFGDEVVLTATSDTYSPEFKQIGSTPCSASEPDQVCRFVSDEDSEIFLSFNATSNPVSVTASAGASGPASGAAAKGATNVAVQQIRVTPNGSPAITSMTLTAAGTGAPEVDILAAKAFIDVNRNGEVDSGDFQLGAGSFSGGTAVVTFDEPYQINTASDLVLAVDFNSTIQAMVWLPFAPWSLLVVIALPVVLMRRRRGLLLCVGIGLVAVATAVACGGSGGSGGNSDDDGDDAQQQGDNGGDNLGDGDGDNDGGSDDDYVPPPGSKTYAFSVTGMTAQQSYSTTTPATVSGLPLTGATISVDP